MHCRVANLAPHFLPAAMVFACRATAIPSASGSVTHPSATRCVLDESCSCFGQTMVLPRLLAYARTTSVASPKPKWFSVSRACDVVDLTRGSWVWQVHDSVETSQQPPRCSTFSFAVDDLSLAGVRARLRGTALHHSL